PDCEENHRAYVPGADCANVVQPLVELPAYSTIVGATVYPDQQRGRFAFPAAYRGGLFATAHGSWHRDATGAYAAKPLVAFIPMKHGRPVTAVDWSDPHRQWSVFVGGFQTSGHTRIGRPTGIAVGSQGSIFVADDTSGSVYRIRPPK
ncbi:MAG TPA: hypothetical protein VNG31_10310, partial [Candidatus Baltobacteraceae bacterium]|nr:hypothetical protein [Candidatus Baltobacteraceae bacterium]